MRSMAEAPRQTPGRKRFTARFTAVDERRRAEIRAAFAFPVPARERNMVLEDYLAISRQRRSTFLPLVKLQLHMLEDLMTVEHMIAEYKRRKESLEADPPAPGSPGARDIEIIEREMYFYRAEQRALRDIADGIVWRLLEYDRALIYELATRSATKHIQVEGLDAELREFAHGLDSGQGIPVLNDLTNVLRLGDVTLFRRD